MPCYKPMLAIPWSINHETGKVQYKFTRKLFSSEDLSEVETVEGKPFKRKALPCGQCLGCRLDYAKEWAMRCILELQDHDINECYFVTLTYDDQHVPYSQREVVGTFRQIDQILMTKGYVGNTAWKEKPSNQTLVFDHLQLFLKNLRRSQQYHYGKQFRFYACGEYGTKTMRPHFHIILYGLHLSEPTDDTWKKSMSGYYVWEDKYLEKIWKNGNVIVGRVTYNSCEYVARYMLKKQKGHYGQFYETFNIEPEACRMSLKPGIGMNYYEKHRNLIYKYDEIHVATEKHGLTFKPPRKFDKAYQEEHPDYYAMLAEDREWQAFCSMVAKEHNSGKPISDILKDAEISRKSKSKILQKRSVGNG